ncbi:SDR family oxidoreductase [Nocardia vinacea]|uniref:SDR family oxidoreductase n=1 Tax=Nocardia vinacea TaxID=96468 RepID=UPI000687DAAB|nr:SDR family oxidoreductase [Nocardia vinacea]
MEDDNNSDVRFDDKVVIVTGAARGLGEAYVRLLAERGARVVVNDLGTSVGGGGTDESIALEVVKSIDAAGGIAVASFADVTTVEGGNDMVDTALAAFGRLDAVINNAGTVVSDGLADVDQESMSRQLAVHTFGSLNVTRAAWPHLVASGGSVLLTTSAAMLGNVDFYAYGMAKAATFGLLRNLAVDAAAQGIRVNAIMPAAETRASRTAPDVHVRPLKSSSRNGPENVAAVACYLVHESCTANGEMFAAGRGYARRIVMSITNGLYADPMTIENVAAQFSRICAAGDLDELTDVQSYRAALSPAEGPATGILFG